MPLAPERPARVSMEYRLRKLGQYLRGWTAYFGINQHYRPVPELIEQDQAAGASACATGNSGAGRAPRSGICWLWAEDCGSNSACAEVDSPTERRTRTVGGVGGDV